MPPPKLIDGRTYKCSGSDKLYRAEIANRAQSGKLRLYPNPEIAKSWNPNWNSDITTLTNCEIEASTLFGPDMTTKLIHNQTYKCKNSDQIYAGFINGIHDQYLKPYLDPETARHFNPKGDSNIITLDCEKEKFYIDRPKFIDGRTYKCKNSDKIYRADDWGILSLYPNKQIAKSWNPKWDSNIITLDCENKKLYFGREKSMKNLINGRSYKCKNSDKIYRADYGALRLYPDPEIAKSWNPKWNSNIITLDCNIDKNLNFGSDMPMKIIEGKTYKCKNSDKIYRGEGYSTLRLYPNKEIARSWNPNYYKNIITFNCNNDKSLYFSEDMGKKEPWDLDMFENVEQCENNDIGKLLIFIILLLAVILYLKFNLI